MVGAAPPRIRRVIPGDGAQTPPRVQTHISPQPPDKKLPYLFLDRADASASH